MAKLRALFLNVSFGIPGALVGFIFAYFDVQDSVAAQIARRGWVDSTGINDVYFLYGLGGYVVSAVVGELIIKRIRRARER